MKRIALCIALLLSLLGPVLLTAPARAAVDVFGACSNNSVTPGAATPSETDVCKQRPAAGQAAPNPIIHGISITITIMAFVIGFTAVVILIISAINMITSEGDPQKFASARKSIIYALIGVVIAVLAQSLVAFTLNKL